MLTFVKYDLKNNKSFIKGFIIFIIVFSVYLQSNLYSIINHNKVFLNLGIINVIIFLALMAAAIITFFKIVNSYADELRKDRGYLTFTLPLSGKQVLGGKLISATLWVLILYSSIVVFNTLLALLLFRNDFIQFLKTLLNLISPYTLSALINVALSSIHTLLLIYLAMTLTTIRPFKRQNNSLWIIYYIFIAYLSGRIQEIFNTIIPYYLNFSDFSLMTKSQYENLINAINLESFSIVLNNASIGMLIYTIISAIGLFYFIAYLLEKKIDI